jgi:uncharacterized protein (DUF1501 family)
MADQSSLDRREFLAGSLGATLMGALPARAEGFFAPGAAANSDVVVVVFLRGAMDGLNFLAPVDDKDYIAARPDTLRLSAAGPVTGIQLTNGPNTQDWRLHPSASALKPLYDAGKLAIIPAAGMLSDSRSHFQSIDLMERGITAGSQSGSATGWLARHMRNVSTPISATSTSTIIPGRLIGDNAAVAMTVPTQFKLSRADFSGFLASVYAGSAPLAAAGGLAITAINSFAATLAAQGTITAPASTSSFQTALNTIVQLIQFKAGLQVATVEVGGWDTHVNQQKIFDGNIADLAGSLAKFQSDVEKLGANVTLVTMTEFGRRVKSNASGGTDHGHGSVMMVMGTAVNGGKIYGRWPGLAAATLNLGDVDITTDYRNVVAEILAVRRGEPSISTVFPALSAYAPLGIVKA